MLRLCDENMEPLAYFRTKGEEGVSLGAFLEIKKEYTSGQYDNKGVIYSLANFKNGLTEGESYEIQESRFIFCSGQSALPRCLRHDREWAGNNKGSHIDGPRLPGVNYHRRDGTGYRQKCGRCTVSVYRSGIRTSHHVL